MYFRWVVALLMMLAAPATAVLGQETSSDWAWKPIVDQDSVAVQYIFYSQTETRDSGIVLKLVNRNDWQVKYRFTVILRSGDGRAFEQDVSGLVPANAILTGDDEGLFFRPFDDGSSIGMIGIRGFSIEGPGSEDS